MLQMAYSSILSQRVFKSRSRNVPMISVSTARPLTYGGWSAEHLDAAAVCAVQRDGVSIRRAVIAYGLPKSTLYDHVSGKVSRLAKPGPKPYLSEEEEEELVNFLVKCAQIGYPHTRMQVLAIVQEIVGTQKN